MGITVEMKSKHQLLLMLDSEVLKWSKQFSCALFLSLLRASWLFHMNGDMSGNKFSVGFVSHQCCEVNKKVIESRETIFFCMCPVRTIEPMGRLPQAMRRKQLLVIHWAIDRISSLLSPTLYNVHTTKKNFSSFSAIGNNNEATDAERNEANFLF